MKHLKQLLAALVFVSLIIFTNCGGKEKEKETDPADVQAAKMEFTWTLAANGAELSGSGAQAEWNGLTLTFNYNGTDGGSYTTTGTQTTDVWPASGTWEFDGTDIGTIVRSDGVEMDINVTSTSLILSFNIDTSGGRAYNIDGAWSFEFESPS